MRIFTTILKWIARAIVGVLAFVGGSLVWSGFKCGYKHYEEFQNVLDDDELCDSCKMQSIADTWYKDTFTF